MSFAEYARHRGVSKAAVSLAIKRGKISELTDEDGNRYLDSETADLQWAANTNPAHATGPQNRKRWREELEKGTEPEPEPPPEEEEPAAEEPAFVPAKEPETVLEPEVRRIATPRNYNDARAEREHYNAELARLKFEETAGKLIDADLVREEAFKLARIVRDSLLALPDRVAGEFAGETNQFRIHTRLTEEIRRALVSLKGENESS
jgi:hypothetical protein